MRPIRSSIIAFTAASVIGASIACAGDGDVDALPREPDGSGDAGDTADVSPADAPDDVSQCSASGLCVTSAPVDDRVVLTSIWGSSATDVWAVGTDTTILHYDGYVWERAKRVIPDGSSSFLLRSVWLERPDDVWIADGNGLRHGTGWRGPDATEWSIYRDQSSLQIPAAIRGDGEAVWVLQGGIPRRPHLLRLEGWGAGGPVAPRELGPTTDQPYTALAITRPDEIWFAGPRVFRASLAEQDAGAPDAALPTWSFEEHRSQSGRFSYGVWGDDAAIWLVGEGGHIQRMTRDAIPDRTFESVSSPVTKDLHSVFGFGPDDIWAVGDASTVIHWDGAAWTQLSTPFAEDDERQLFAVWGSSPNDVWIVGHATVLHFAPAR